MKKTVLKLLFIVFLAIPKLITAHAPEQSYIYLRVLEVRGIEGRFEIQIRDLNKVFDWDFKNGAPFSDFQPHLNQIHEYLIKNAAFRSEFGAYPIEFKEVSFLRLGDGDYVQFNFKLNNVKDIPDELQVTYSGVLDKIPTHRGFLIVEHNWKAGIINNEALISLGFRTEKTTETLSLTEASIFKGFVAMIRQGVWHIWIGLDHILFLFALILPAVVRRIREQKKMPLFESWTPVERFKPAILYILKIITFFTIAHTITLSLATLQIVNLPSRLVESIIAFSIGLAAYHNIRPIFKGRDWMIAFIFGLFHGFGFASVLGDLGLNGQFLTLSLLGFNIGVEVGQLLIIFMIFPVLFLIRKQKLYPKIIVFGSVFLIIVSLYWSIERIFDVDLWLENYIRSVGYKVAVALGLR